MIAEMNGDGFPRRSFLKMAGAGLAPLGMGSGLAAFGEQPQQTSEHSARMITRQKEPANLEFPFSDLVGPLTPNELFYVRSHFATPQINASDWKLQIEGAVGTPLTITLDELRSMPSKTITATLECAGNGRMYLSPVPRGVLWEQGAVSTAEWTGVPLSAILEKAGLHTNALEIILEGTDSGEMKDPPHPGAALNFSRSIPLEKANQANVLIAYEMNGKPLSPSHGFPVRAIVPGWYAVASVKWLKRMVVVTHPFPGYFQTVDYAYWEHQDGFARRTPLTTLLVKSQIARPSAREIVPAGKTTVISGAAWSGDPGIAKVEVSVDGGKSWNVARLTGDAKPGAWRLWEYDWMTSATPGRAVLMSRATDNAGNVQPATRDLDRENYMINQIVPIEVEVR